MRIESPSNDQSVRTISSFGIADIPEAADTLEQLRQETGGKLLFADNARISSFIADARAGVDNRYFLR